MSDSGTPKTPQDWTKLWQEQGQHQQVYAQKAPGQVPYGFGGYEMRYAYAGWPSRVIASVIDGIFTTVVVLLVFGTVLASLSLGGTTIDEDAITVAYLPAMGVYLLIVAWFQWRNGSTGQTPGKAIMHIRVVREETGETLGGPMGLVRGVVGWAISAFTCGLGGLVDVLWPLFDSKNRTIHDMVVGSVVISGQ